MFLERRQLALVRAELKDNCRRYWYMARADFYRSEVSKSVDAVFDGRCWTLGVTRHR